MREIKFRAWHKHDKVMVECDDGVGGFYYNGGMTDPDYIKLQYTGLQDKNGKEIYEGDVVRFMVNTSRGLIEQFYTIHDIRDSFSPFDCARDIQIIGNIYSNPELLK